MWKAGTGLRTTGKDPEEKANGRTPAHPPKAVDIYFILLGYGTIKWRSVRFAILFLNFGFLLKY